MIESKTESKIESKLNLSFNTSVGESAPTVHDDSFDPIASPDISGLSPCVDATSDIAASARGYHIMTWGCQMNEEDSEQIALYMERIGFHQVSTAEVADVVLLNTCSVRAKPEEKVWSELGRLKDIKRLRPDMVIGVCGCMAQVESLEIKKRAPHVDIVVGTGNIASIPAMVQHVRANRSNLSGSHETAQNVPTQTGELLLAVDSSDIHTKNTESNTDQAGQKLIPVTALVSRGKQKLTTLTALQLPARKGAIVTDVPDRVTGRKPKIKAHVPIMYGCDKFCTFCIVPHTRGRERSRPTDEIILEIEGLAASGTREVTLLGQTVNSYGKNLAEGRVPFAHLLERIDAIPGIERIRFTSPYPKDFTDELIDTIGRLKHVCEHVHLPLQVGDDDLLQEMHRGYTVQRYREIVAKLRSSIPGVALTTDIMLGYPGETDAQFWNTMHMVEELRFDSAFMFAYSPRPNTKAAVLENQIPQKVKIERLQALVEMQNRITVEINRSQVGEVFEVLVEGRSDRDSDKLTGYTRTLKTINFSIPTTLLGTVVPETLIGKLVRVRTLQAHLTGFTGEYTE